MATLNPQVLQTIDEGLRFYVQTASKPKPKDAFLIHQWEMCCVHSFLLTALRRTAELCPIVKPKDYHDYVLYNLLWVNALHLHHEHEEEDYLPLFGDRLQMTSDKIKEEHASFHAQLHDLEIYLIECLPQGTPWGLQGQKVSRKDSSAPREFESAKLAQLLTALAQGPLLKHLESEISYLSADSLRNAGFTADELNDILAKALKAVDKIVSTGDLPLRLPLRINARDVKIQITLPMAIYFTIHTPKEVKDFPPVPGIIKSFLVPHVLYWTQRKTARFSPIVKYGA